MIATPMLKKSHIDAMFPFFDHIHDGLMMVDSDQQITRVNRSAAEMFKYVPSELQGKSLDLLVPDRYRHNHATHSETFFRAPVTREMQPLSRLIGLTKEGEEIAVGVSLNPVHISGRLHVLAIIRDMQEWEVMKQHLSVSRKMETIATMASGIAHNFNNITTAIHGNIYLAKKWVAHDTQRQYLEEATELTHHASGIVRQLLAYTHGAHKPSQQLCLKDILNEAIRVCEMDMPGDTEIACDFTDMDTCYQGDPDQLHQVFHNMLKNAVHATEESMKKRISVSLAYQPRQGCEFRDRCKACGCRALKVTVEDTGKGIEQTHLEKIFDPFFTTKGRKGSGLGLSMSLGTIKSHGGEIHVKSQVDEGTSFIVCLPAS